MKSTGIVRHIDPLGRVVLPKELRRVLEISDGDPIEIYVDGDRIVLKKYKPGCHICGSVENKLGMVALGKSVCEKCITEIVKTHQLAERVSN